MAETFRTSSKSREKGPLRKDFSLAFLGRIAFARPSEGPT